MSMIREWKHLRCMFLSFSVAFSVNSKNREKTKFHFQFSGGSASGEQGVLV